LKDIIKTVTHSSDRNKMIKNWMKERKIFPSSVPPKKIKIKKPTEKTFFQKLWQ
jgi:hypothetical protein